MKGASYSPSLFFWGSAKICYLNLINVFNLISESRMAENQQKHKDNKGFCMSRARNLQKQPFLEPHQGSAELGDGGARVDPGGRANVQPNGCSNIAPTDAIHQSQGADARCPSGIAHNCDDRSYTCMRCPFPEKTKCHANFLIRVYIAYSRPELML